jgi:S1-C subfamily serine protease
VVRELGDRELRITFQRGTQAPPSMRAGAGRDVWLGSVPDMAAGAVKGMRLSGVTPGSPADQAGLVAGDVIVEFDGKPVTDLYTYSDALYARQPGDRVKIVFLRGGERKEVEVTLGRRGQRSS